MRESVVTREVPQASAIVGRFSRGANGSGSRFLARRSGFCRSGFAVCRHGRAREDRSPEQLSAMEAAVGDGPVGAPSFLRPCRSAMRAQYASRNRLRRRVDDGMLHCDWRPGEHGSVSPPRASVLCKAGSCLKPDPVTTFRGIRSLSQTRHYELAHSQHDGRAICTARVQQDRVFRLHPFAAARFNAIQEG